MKGSRRVMQYSLPAGSRIVVQLGIIRTLVAPSNSWRLCSVYHVVASEVEVGAAWTGLVLVEAL